MERKSEATSVSIVGRDTPPERRELSGNTSLVLAAPTGRSIVPVAPGPQSFVHASGIIPKIQNVVSSVNLGVKLDLRKIVQSAKNAEYNPKRFVALVMRLREPRTTALVFSSGKIVCIGAKSEDEARLASRKYARIIQKIGFKDVQFRDFKIQNIVGSCGVKFPIRLEGLACDHEDYSCYEPEMFPGLIYRMVQPKIVLLIFVSGKVVLTGAKTRLEIYEAFENIYPVLNEFRKPLELGEDEIHEEEDEDDIEEGLEDVLEDDAI